MDAHGHWCTFTDLYHTIPYHTMGKTTTLAYSVALLAPLRSVQFSSDPQCLPSDIVPIRSWTRTLRPPGIRHRHLPYHTIPWCVVWYGMVWYGTYGRINRTDHNTIPYNRNDSAHSLATKLNLRPYML